MKVLRGSIYIEIETIAGPLWIEGEVLRGDRAQIKVGTSRPK